MEQRLRHQARQRKTTIYAGILTLFLLTGLLAKNFFSSTQKLSPTQKVSSPREAKTQIKGPVSLLARENTYLLLGSQTKDLLVMFHKPHEIKAIIIPGTTFVEISGDGFREISQVLDLGVPATLATVKNLLGLDIEHYLQVNTDDFKNLAKKNLLGRAFSNSALSDLQRDQRLKISRKIAKVKPDKIEIFSLPVKPISVDQKVYLEPQVKRMERLVRDIWRGKSPQTAIKVMILNGSGLPGVAQKVAQKLTEKGYEIKSSRNAESFNYDQTRILVYRKKKAAEEIRALLGVGVLVNVKLSPKSADVTIVIGRDYGGSP